MDRRIDVALALAVAALGIVIVVSAQFIRPSPVPDPIGPRGIPTGVGTLFVLGGVALAARRLRAWSSESTFVTHEGSEDDPGVPPGSARRAMGIWLSAFAYTVTLPYLGFVIGTPLLIAAMLRLLELRRPPLFGVIPMIVVLSLAFTAAAWAIFALVLGVRLPLGVVRELYLLLGDGS